MNAIEVTMSEEEFEDMLNDCYEPVKICGMEYEQGTALKKLDPVAFRCALSDMDIQYGCSKCRALYDSEQEAEECCKEDDE